MTTKQQQVTECVRIDAGDGSETVVPIRRAYNQIDAHYDDAQQVKDSLHDGHPVRTTFAIYELRTRWQ